MTQQTTILDGPVTVPTPLLSAAERDALEIARAILTQTFHPSNNHAVTTHGDDHVLVVDKAHGDTLTATLWDDGYGAEVARFTITVAVAA